MKMRKSTQLMLLFFILTMVMAACSNNSNNNTNNSKNSNNNSNQQQDNIDRNENDRVNQSPSNSNNPNTDTKPETPTGEETPNSNEETRPVVLDPNSVEVLVNKQYGLPDNHAPTDLVYPDVHFIFDDKIEKRKLRQEAATALEQMFKGAADDGVHLGGVSGYRSNATQRALFNRYVERDGEEKAKTYSAVPGHSEHETGLAIDVSGSDGKCAAQDCFGGTKEAIWLAEHAHEYGFIIRYPEGKEHITGYQYEPWHLRYVGKQIASVIFEEELTLEEYYNAVPVSQ